MMIALRTRDGAEPLSVRGLVLVCRTVLPRTAASQSAVPQKAVVEKSKTIMFVDTRVASNKGRYAVGARYPSGPQPPKRPEIEIGGEDATRTQRVDAKNLYFIDEEEEIVHTDQIFRNIFLSPSFVQSRVPRPQSQSLAAAQMIRKRLHFGRAE